MAKAIISSILEAQLGKYVDGLRSDSLVVGLWSGELELRDLRLKPHALAELQLPVTVASGTVARVLVRVPWNQLGSASVSISLEGVSALIVPNTERPTSAELLQTKQNQLERRELLRQHRRFAARVASGETNEKQQASTHGEDEGTFVSRLTARIVANLHVTLHDVHFRYEDTVANPETPFACGFILKQFGFYTTDQEGKEDFVDHTGVQNGFTFKKAQLTHFGLYWDRLSSQNTRLEMKETVQKALNDMLKPEELDRRQWVLQPCSVAVQFTKNESTDYSTVAKYTVQAQVGALHGHITREQYQDGVFVRRAFMGRQAVEAHFVLARGRPFHPPGARPREWWDYTTRLVLERVQRNGGKDRSKHKHLGRHPYYRKMRWSSMHQAMLERQLYLEAFRVELRHGSAFDRSTREGKIKCRYEEIYPIDVVLRLRDIAQDAEERQAAEVQASNVQNEQKGGSWYSYFFGETEIEVREEDGVLSLKGRDNLREAYHDAVEKASSAHQVPTGCNLLSIQLELTKGTLALYQSNTHKSPFVTGTVHGSMAVNIQPENEWDARICVQKFGIVNGLASDTRFHSFCSPSTSSADPSVACVSIDISRRAIFDKTQAQDTNVEATLKLRVRSQPIRVLIDPFFVLFLRSFFVSLLPEKELEKVWHFATSSVAEWMFADDTKYTDAVAQKEAQEAELMHSLEQAQGRAVYDVVVDLEAPVLILPEHVGDPTGAVLVVDLGKLRVCNEDKAVVGDTQIDTTQTTNTRLQWRVEVTRIFVSLGRQEQLVHWTDQELGTFRKIVQDLSINLLLDTRASSSRLRLPSRKKNRAVNVRPHVGAYTDIPMIVISLTEDQLVAISRIQSSFVTQATQENSLGSLNDQHYDISSDESAQELESFNDESKEVAVVDEKFVFELQLSLGCIELILHESVDKVAFVLRASHSSFALERYSAHQNARARLKALVMEDRLYSSNSRFFHLISTGQCNSKTPHLIVVDVVTSLRKPSARHQMLHLEADVHFNVLHMQWNPSSMALFYRLFFATASAFEYSNDVSVFQDSNNRPSQHLTPASSTDAISKKHVASLSTLRARGRPTVVVRASLVHFSVTLNKDQQHRQLARLEMTDSAIKYTQYEAETGQDAYEVTGYVGNFTGTDLSTSKHPLYATLLGLDEDEARRRPATEEQVRALLNFEYVNDTVISDKSRLCLSFLPIRGVYYHQQILELVDFVLTGVLGAIVCQTLINATQLLLREDEASTVLDLSVEKPTLILPLSLQDAPHAKVTAGRLRLVHYPSSIVRYDGPFEAGSKRVVHNQVLPRAIIRSPEGISLRVDCKDLFLEQVRIYCTSPKTKMSDQGPMYEDLVPQPADLKISIEDLVSSIISLERSAKEYLPRFTVHSVLPPLEIHISRTSYLGIVALLLKNFGADELKPVLSVSCEIERTTDELASRRPVVTYSYLQPDSDQATIQLQFLMKKIRILLFQDTFNEVSSVLSSPSNRGQTFRTDAFADIIATNFSLVFNKKYDKNPCLLINLGAFSARDLIGKYNDGGNCGTLMVSTDPQEMRYTWDDTASNGEINLVLSKVIGTVRLNSLLTIADFFALPSSSDRPENLDHKNKTDTLLQPPARNIPPSLLTRRESISDILKDGKDADLTMTIRVTAQQVGVALPRNAYDLKSPQVAFTGDFTLESVWRPHPKKNKNASNLDIQKSIIFDARNMEIVLENARRLGCCVASPSENGQYDAIDVAPLIQLLEPSSLHVEVSDLFPHAGQRQQIVALKFTPIQVYASYEDACMGIETIDSLNHAIDKHKQFVGDSKRLSHDENFIYQSLTKSPSSPKNFATQDLNGTEMHRYFTCELPSVSLTLVNDCDGCDMGLAQLQIERCHVFLNITSTVKRKEIMEKSDGLTDSDFSVSTNLSGGGNLVVLMSYYNPETRDWHSMCAEWALAASVQGSIASENELHVILTASQALDLTITHGLLEVVASVGGAWKRRAALRKNVNESKDDDLERRKLAPCVIRNETGLPLRFWLSNETFTTEPHIVATGKLADVRYLHASGRGRGVVRRYSSGDREAANLRLFLQLMDSKHGAARFHAVEGLIFEQLGTRTFPLVDTQEQQTSFTLSLSSQLVEGRILLVVSSPIKLVSRLSAGRAVALLVNDPTWHSPVEIGILRSNQESAVPVLLSLASELRVRPVENGVTYAWSAPIPVQTRSAAELKVEAAVSREPSTSHRTAVYCVSMSSWKEMRTVSFAEPLILVNKLPVSVTFRVQSAYSSAYGTSESPSEFQTIAVGAKTSIWWTDVAQRPLFQLEVEGCTTPSKWLELTPQGTANGAVLSVQLVRVNDKRPFQLLIRVVGDTKSSARPVRVEILANVWMINRSGLELVYGTAADGEAYLPPYAARAQVGNAQISAYSSDSSDKVPVLRIGLRGCNWSARFEADPKRLSWQDECITLRSAGGSASSRGVLYELGVSADYATRHFGSVTTLVSVIPRYLIVNRSSHTVLLLEAPTRQSQRLEDSKNGNVAHHVLGSGDWYALYWVGGLRAPLRASVLPNDSVLGSFCPDGYDWSAAFAVDQVGTTNLVVPPRSSGRGVNLEITVKRGSFSQATFVVVVTDTDPTLTLSSARLAKAAIARTIGWQTFTLHAQVAGVIMTVTDKMPNDVGHLETESVARATLTRINLEATWSPLATAAKLNLMGLKVEDLLPQSKDRVVFRPLSQDESTDKSFLELSYLERPHAKYTWVERVHLELQNAKVSTSMSFVDRLHKLQRETCAHFQHKSLVADFPSEHDVEVESDDEELLAYFVLFNEEGQGDLTAMTGRKLYIASGEISPMRVIVSFTRDKSDSSQREGFWLSNLKLKIENACVTLEGYRLSHALATQESLGAAIVRSYEQSVKSQALNLIDSIQVTSLVTSIVTEGVTSLVSTLRGKADPAAAAGALAPGLLTSSVEIGTSLGAPFQYERLSNGEIMRKHSRALEVCSSNAEFLRQVRHLVYDWDANHTGLGARGCVALALINNSRHSLVVNTQLNDGASLRVLPLGRRQLAGVLDTATDEGSAAAKGSNTWRSNRALVVFAYGYTPTLLTSGDIYFTVQSNACNVYATRKTARLKANRGYTATFTLQETQSWWAVNVVIIGDALQANDSTTFDSDTHFEDILSAPGQGFVDGGDEYEVEFKSVSLGLVAKQSGRSVIVRECVPSSAAEDSGQIAAGDCIVAVNGVSVANTSQFKYLVTRTPRPIVLRFRPTGRHSNAAYDLFGEGEEDEAKLFG